MHRREEYKDSNNINKENVNTKYKPTDPQKTKLPKNCTKFIYHSILVKTYQEKRKTNKRGGSKMHRREDKERFK